MISKIPFLKYFSINSNFLHYSDIILINRGWVPVSKMKAAKRQEGQKTGLVELQGVVRLGENRKPLSLEHKGNLYFYR